jgi:purine-nucleoside phosphorylase
MTNIDSVKAIDFCNTYEKKVNEAARYIASQMFPFTILTDKNKRNIDFGIVLGSGLGNLADKIKNPKVIPYSKIPHFPTTTVPGHAGDMIIGTLENVPIIALKGRKHYYEVADLPFNMGILQTVFPVHVLAELGVKNYFSTNAVGGLNPNYQVGDMMIIKSHINFIPNPLLGRHHNFSRVDNNPNDEKNRVWRFQPMNGAYDSNLRKILKNAGSEYPKNIHEGTLLAVTGPSYETEGECIAFRDGLKADAVGMSTAPEIIIARNRGMNAVGMSCITNVIAPDGTNATNHEEVKRILESEAVKTRLSNTISNFFELYKRQQ